MSDDPTLRKVYAAMLALEYEERLARDPRITQALVWQRMAHQQLLTAREREQANEHTEAKGGQR